jgi:hypothetical protein
MVLLAKFKASHLLWIARHRYDRRSHSCCRTGDLIATAIGEDAIHENNIHV